MNILITGINGFIGTSFYKRWKEDKNIYGLSSSKKDIKKGVFSWNELSKIPELDTIIHLAGKAHDTKNRSKTQIYFDINTGLTQKIFDYFLQSSAKKFIFFSSVKAVADRVEGEILTENFIPQPKGPYGESKIKAENYILSKKHEFEAKDKKVYILRPCMVHGPNNKGNLNLLYNVVKKRIPWPLGKYDNKRSFCSIDNLTYVVENLIESDISSGIYHIADDDTLSTNELINIINETIGTPTMVFNVSKKIIGAVAKIGDVFCLPLNSERLQKLTENYVVSNKKIKLAMQKELPLSSEEGIRLTIKSFK